jgi:hypothetical protein
MPTMKKNTIDYKIFVPRGENNYVRLKTGMEFDIDEILTVNIHLGDDKVTYWIYFRIPHDDKPHKFLLTVGKKSEGTLLIGNNPYEIIGELEVMQIAPHKWEEKIQIIASLVVVNSSQVVDNPRKEVKHTRSELLDIRED